MFPPEFLSLKGLTVLVADDRDSAQIMACTLQLEGATVITAVSFSEAAKVLNQIKPDLLITSLRLSDIDGYLLLRYLRALEAERSEMLIPAVATTQCLDEIDPDRFPFGGFQGYLAKPILPIALLNVVTDLTERILCPDFSQLQVRRHL